MQRFASRFAVWAMDFGLHAGFLGGAGAAVYGVWLIYHPAGFIVGGSLAVAGCYIVARTR